MKECMQFYINGEWVDPVDPKSLDVINPATEEVIGKIAMGNSQDVDKAVAAAKEAFESFSQTTKEERLALMGKILEVYQSRYDEIAETISSEMGAPLWLSKAAQAATGAGHLGTFLEILKNYEFEREILDEKDNYTVFKVLGDTQEIEKLLSELKKEEFLEVTRSGTLGITKGNESLATNDQTKISYD